MTATAQKIVYSPWQQMTHKQRCICVAEKVFGWSRIYDLEDFRIKWVRFMQNREELQPEVWPPNYFSDYNLLGSVKRQFASWTVEKIGAGDYQATLVDMSGNKMIATGVTEADALLLAAVRLRGACV